VEPGWLDDLCTLLGRQLQPTGPGSGGSSNGAAATPSSDAAGGAGADAAGPARQRLPAGLSYKLRWRLGQALQRLRYWPSHEHGKHIWRLLRSLPNWRPAARKRFLLLAPQQRRAKVLVRNKWESRRRAQQGQQGQQGLLLDTQRTGAGGSRSQGPGECSKVGVSHRVRQDGNGQDVKEPAGTQVGSSSGASSVKSSSLQQQQQQRAGTYWQQAPTGQTTSYQQRRRG
jgi:hypothetical protein